MECVGKSGNNFQDLVLSQCWTWQQEPLPAEPAVLLALQLACRLKVTHSFHGAEYENDGRATQKPSARWLQGDFKVSPIRKLTSSG